MTAEYKQSAGDAQRRSDTAKESSDRHSHEAAQMKESAAEAADRLNKAKQLQRKRKPNEKLPKR